MAATTDDPDAIERDLTSTRARLDSRLSELANRLSPGQILDEGLDLLRTREGVEFSRNLGGAVRERPIPVALVGIGLAWLMAGPRGPSATGSGMHLPRRSIDPRLGQPRVRTYDEALATRAWEAGRNIARNEGESDVDYRARATEARGKVLGIARAAQDTAESYADRVHDALFAARDAVGDAASGWADTAGTIGAKLGDAMQGASDRVASSAHDLRDQAGTWGGRMSDQGRRMGDAAAGGLQRARATGTGVFSELASAISDNPVLLGALGLTAGALLGALLPPTQLEQEYLGEAAHDARDALKDVVRDATDRGAEVAQAAMAAGRQTAQEIADHAGKLGGAAADAARDVAGQAQQRAGELSGTASEAARSVAANAADGSRPSGR